MVGIDTVFIPRMKKAVESEAFVNRVFTPSERAYADGKADPVNTFAGMFCAKEAVSKALKYGFGNGLMPIDIEIGHEPDGSPTVIAHGAAEKLLDRLFCDVSITHDGDYAIAIAILRKRSESEDYE